MCAKLDYDSAHTRVEGALRALGDLIGLEATRPDSRGGKGTGPDVLWLAPECNEGAALEAKTNKQKTSEYSKKDDIGQYHDHIQWLTKQYPKHHFMKYIVGRRLRVSAESNPPIDLKIVPLEEFQELAGLAIEVADMSLASSSGDLALAVEQNMQALGTKWPHCVRGLESFAATDLQSEPSSDDDWQ